MGEMGRWSSSVEMEAGVTILLFQTIVVYLFLYNLILNTTQPNPNLHNIVKRVLYLKLSIIIKHVLYTRFTAPDDSLTTCYLCCLHESLAGRSPVKRN